MCLFLISPTAGEGQGVLVKVSPASKGGLAAVSVEQGDAKFFL